MDKILKTILDIKSQKGISDRKFTLDLGLGAGVVTDWKKERSRSYLKYLPIIADYLEIPIDLLTGKISELNRYSKIKKLNLNDSFELNEVLTIDKLNEKAFTDSETTFDKEEINLIRLFRKFNKTGKKKIMAYMNDIYPNKKLKDE